MIIVRRQGSRYRDPCTITEPYRQATRAAVAGGGQTDRQAVRESSGVQRFARVAAASSPRERQRPVVREGWRQVVCKISMTHQARFVFTGWLGPCDSGGGQRSAIAAANSVRDRGGGQRLREDGSQRSAIEAADSGPDRGVGQRADSGGGQRSVIVAADSGRNSNGRDGGQRSAKA